MTYFRLFFVLVCVVSHVKHFVFAVLHENPTFMKFHSFIDRSKPPNPHRSALPLAVELQRLQSPLAGGLQQVQSPLAGGLQQVQTPLAGGLQWVQTPLAGGLQWVQTPLTWELHCSQSLGTPLNPPSRYPLSASLYSGCTTRQWW